MLAILRNNNARILNGLLCYRRGIIYGRVDNINWNRNYCLKSKKIQTEDSLTKQERLKKAVKEYGVTIIVFHVTISLISLGAFYVLVSSGIDMTSLLKKFENLSANDSMQNTVVGASNFVIAYAIHKVFAPIRIAITLSTAPLLVRHLRSKGFLKK